MRSSIFRDYVGTGRLLLGGSLVLAAAILAAGCGDDAPGSTVTGDAAPSSVTVVAAGGAYMRVGPAEFEQVMAREPGALVLNVHIPYAGEIEGTDVFLPYDEVAARAAELPADLAAPILVYCQSGRMSSEAAATLVSLGFTNVIDLEGGMLAWQASGREILRLLR